MKTESVIEISNPIRTALFSGRAVVALESAVITHGLPYPQNLNLAREMEAVIESEGAQAATVAVLNGKIRVGLKPEEIEQLATLKKARKISRRDFGAVLASAESGGTTVAGTMVAAHQAGVRVFATGGIGGVHRNAPFDVSADLYELSRTAMIVVCAGAKAILDLPATLEVLETLGVAVVGYQCNEFPAFYSPNSGLTLNFSADSPQQIAAIARAQWDIGIHSAVLVANPPPAESALPRDAIEAIIQQAVSAAESAGLTGAALTPYLLDKVADLSSGSSLVTNVALLLNNARLAARIALALAELESPRLSG
jgi:pseudouridine-5'-phosphate glycosidase